MGTSSKNRENFHRPLVDDILRGLKKHDDLIHVIVGARQVGKTTAAGQIGEVWKGPIHFAAADQMLPPGPEWIETQWHLARQQASESGKPVLLILDELQKIPQWSEAVKARHDEDRRKDIAVVPLLLGSSSLLLQKGLSESLAGRFVLHRFPHWSFGECNQAFGWDLETWLYFGGYPAGSRFADDEIHWQNYIADSLIETAITRDILQMQNIAKPTLLRHLFALAAQLPAQILSYNKMLGQLQDAGNTTTLAHYLRLLASAFLVSGLEQFRGGARGKHGSSPKLILWNSALVNALSGRRFLEARKDPAYWGRIVENAVGAHLLNYLHLPRHEVHYWRQRNDEVDFVVKLGQSVWAIEVKSGRPGKIGGMDAFRKLYPKAKALLIGASGISLEDFFRRNPEDLFQESPSRSR